MKILNSTSITGNMSKLLETPDNFIINGQMYDKSTFSPVPMSFCPINISSSNEIMLSSTAYVQASWMKSTINTGYVLDNTDPNVFYTCTQDLGNGIASGITKVTKNPNGSFSTVWYAISSAGYWSTADIICQDSTKIYYIMNREYGPVYYAYIGSVDKATLSIGSAISMSMGYVKILKVTDMYIYIAANTVSADTTNIGRYNKTNNVLTWLLQDTTATGYCGNNIISDMNSNGVFYSKRDSKGWGSTDHFITYRKYVLDIAKDTCVASTVTLDNSKYPTANIPFFTTADMGAMYHMVPIIDPNTNKRYMTCLVYNAGTRYPNNLNIKDCAMYTYEMIDDDHWTLVSWINFQPVIYKTALPILNNQTIMMGYENGVHIYSWNSGTTSYQKVTSIDTTIFAFGIDNNNNLYIQYADKSVDMISNVMPINVYCDFEKDEYAYNSTNILTNVSLYVQNYQNKYLSTSVQLTLYGNCKFTSNNLRTITITTSNLDKMQIPVTVTGEGNLEVSYKLL